MIVAAASHQLVAEQHRQRLVRSQQVRTLLALRRLADAVAAQRRATRRLEAARSRAGVTLLPSRTPAVR